MKINSHVIYLDNEKELLLGMDEAGFDKALAEGSPEGALYTGKRPGCDNESLYKAIKIHADRLIGCAYINPLEKDALSEVDKWADSGFKAVKIYPADGYYPDDKSLYPFYSKTEQRGLALMAHMGISDFSYDDAVKTRKSPNASYAYPMKFDPICRLFPKLNIVILNMGYPLMAEAWSVHHNSRNIYLHLGGEGTPFRAPATGFSSMGANGFIPLDAKRIVFGSGSAHDMNASYILFKEALVRMGLEADDACYGEGKNVKKLFGLEESDDG